MTSVSATVPTFGYPMNKWVFEDTAGKYEIDLSRSYVEGGRLSELSVPEDLELGYGADRGTAELRERIAALYSGSPEEVLVTHGAQESLALLYSTLLRPGDQLITFVPGWQQSWEAPARMGCQVDAVPMYGDFAIDVEAIAALATDRLRIIVVNSPCNPTGRRARPEEIHGLVELLERHDAYLILDQNYEFDLTPPAPDSQRVISVSGLSKIYGFPGLRVGWMYGPQSLVQTCTDRKFLTSISNSVLCEVLACQVLSRNEHYLSRFSDQVSAGVAILEQWVARHPDTLRLTPPEGTPFGWIQLPEGSDSLAFCRRALERGVLLMPAETLGGTGGFRIGVALPAAQLWDGLDRLDYILEARPISNGVFPR